VHICGLGTVQPLSAGIFEEVGKGAGVALAYLLLRHRFDDVVTGVVLGAAGLGFNLTESVEYIAGFSGGSADFQFWIRFWIRQIVGLMGAHTAFSALVGAAFGMARRLGPGRAAWSAIGCGFVAAAGGHFANNVLLRWFGQLEFSWVTPGSIVDVLPMQPMTLLILQGPFILIYALLLRRAVREQAVGLAGALRAEVQTNFSAITESEASLLLSPGRRFRFRIMTVRRYGFAAYRAVKRLHAAQLDLATHWWHRTWGGHHDWITHEHELRKHVWQRKLQLSDAILSSSETSAVRLAGRTA